MSVFELYHNLVVRNREMVVQKHNAETALRIMLSQYSLYFRHYSKIALIVGYDIVNVKQRGCYISKQCTGHVVRSLVR